MEQKQTIFKVLDAANTVDVRVLLEAVCIVMGLILPKPEEFLERFFIIFFFASILKIFQKKKKKKKKKNLPTVLFLTYPFYMSLYLLYFSRLDKIINNPSGTITIINSAMMIMRGVCSGLLEKGELKLEVIFACLKRCIPCK